MNGIRRILIPMLLAVIPITFFAGCKHTANILPDEYLFGQDQQYGLFSSISGSLCESEDGEYFLSGPQNSYLYYYDKKTKGSLPLCNKPNCLHTNQTNSKLVSTCDAFLGLQPRYLIYYNKNVYYLVRGVTNNGYAQCLMRSSYDGSEKEKLYTFNEEVYEIVIHRGTFYYITSNQGTIAGQEESTKTACRLKKLEMSHLEREPETLTESEEIWNYYNHIVCYGNNVYFYEGFFTDSSMQEEKQYLRRYNVQTEKTDMVFDDFYGHYTILDKKLYALFPDGIYSSDLTGKNRHHEFDYAGMLFSNNKYLFIINDTEDARIIYVTDSMNKLIATINTDKARLFPLGCDESFFYIPSIDGQNEYGDIVSLYALNLSDLDNSSQFELLYKFEPQVPYIGVTN